MTTTEKAIIPIILVKTLISINLGGGGFSPWKTSLLSHCSLLSTKKSSKNILIKRIILDNGDSYYILRRMR